MPHEGRHAVERPRRGGEGLQRRAVPSLPGDRLLAPEPVQQVVVLDGQGDAVADVLAEPRVDRAGVAATHHQVGAAAGQVLQGRVVLGDPDRVGRGDQRGGGGQDQPGGLGRDVGQRRGRRRGDEGRVVVLTRGEDVEPDLLGLLGDRDRRPDPLLLGRRATGGRVPGEVAHGEDAELHVCSPLVVAISTIPTPRGNGYSRGGARGDGAGSTRARWRARRRSGTAWTRPRRPGGSPDPAARA